MNAPNTAALMFIAHRAAESRVHAALQASGFDDLTAAQTKLAQRLDPNGIRVTDLADRARVTKQTAGALVAELERGADMAVGRRRPLPGVRWPWHARLGNQVVCWRLRTRHGVPVHDIAPMRVVHRDAIVALGVEDRRSGYPLELLVRAGAAGWNVAEHDIAYGSRTGGKSKVSGSLRGSFFAVLDFWRVIS